VGCRTGWIQDFKSADEELQVGDGLRRQRSKAVSMAARDRLTDAARAHAGAKMAPLALVESLAFRAHEDWLFAVMGGFQVRDLECRRL
jgi:hypothetical protein